MPRTTVRLGDPGIDARWVRRRKLGTTAVVVWMLGTMALLAIGTPMRLPPVGWIEAWQEATFGGTSPILAVLPLIPLVWAPKLALRLPARADRPFLLGIQQACDTGAGPRFMPSDDAQRGAMHRALTISAAILALCVCAIVAGIVLAIAESDRPAATPIRVTYVKALVSHGDGPPLRIADAGPSREYWLQVETVRGHTTRTAWRAIRPIGGRGRDRLFQSTWTSQRDDGTLEPIGQSGVGRVRPMDDWIAGELRAAGFDVAPHPLQLDTWTADGDSFDAALPGYLTAMIGLVGTILAGAFTWRFRRLAAAIPDGNAKRSRAR